MLVPFFPWVFTSLGCLASPRVDCVYVGLRLSSSTQMVLASGSVSKGRSSRVHFQWYSLVAAVGLSPTEPACSRAKYGHDTHLVFLPIFHHAYEAALGCVFEGLRHQRKPCPGLVFRLSVLEQSLCIMPVAIRATELGGVYVAGLAERAFQRVGLSTH